MHLVGTATQVWEAMPKYRILHSFNITWGFGTELHSRHHDYAMLMKIHKVVLGRALCKAQALVATLVIQLWSC